jgi:DNA-binding NtrC family response regulator
MRLLTPVLGSPELAVATQARQVQVRVVATARAELQSAIESGKLRSNLYHRPVQRMMPSLSASDSAAASKTQNVESCWA